MALPDLHRTREGWELQFATNHLGHFDLALKHAHAESFYKTSTAIGRLLAAYLSGHGSNGD